MKNYKNAVISLCLGIAAILFLTGFGPSDIVEDRCRQQAYQAADCGDFQAGGAGQAKNVIFSTGGVYFLHL